MSWQQQLGRRLRKTFFFVIFMTFFILVFVFSTAQQYVPEYMTAQEALALTESKRQNQTRKNTSQAQHLADAAYCFKTRMGCFAKFPGFGPTWIPCDQAPEDELIDTQAYK